MTDLSRRDAVKLAAGLATCAGGLGGGEARGDEKPPAGRQAAAQPQVDGELEQALKSPLGFIFSEQVTFKLQGDGSSRELAITSATDLDRKPTRVFVRSATMRIFRADAGIDAFTRQGGVYWRFNHQEGTLKFQQPGALVMVVREQGDTVRCYSLVYDERC